MRKLINREKSDMDHKTQFKLLRGRLTKRRYKILDSFCRKNSFSTHCHHEHDCCGCLCGQSMHFKHNPVTQKTLIVISQSFNY